MSSAQIKTIKLRAPFVFYFKLKFFFYSIDYHDEKFLHTTRFYVA